MLDYARQHQRNVVWFVNHFDFLRTVGLVNVPVCLVSFYNCTELVKSSSHYTLTSLNRFVAKCANALAEPIVLHSKGVSNGEKSEKWTKICVFRGKSGLVC